MPLYTLLLRDEDLEKAGLSEADSARLFQQFVDWSADLDRRGKLRGVERLLAPTGSATVRQRDGRIVVDGPYTEGKEAVLGFFLIEAADADEAAAIAGEAPSVPLGGAVEVREIGEFPKPALGEARRASGPRADQGAK